MIIKITDIILILAHAKHPKRPGKGHGKSMNL